MRLGSILSLSVLLFGSAVAQAGMYNLEIRSHYQFGGSANIGENGSPDTGFGIFSNIGSGSFTGHLTASGVAANGQVISLDSGVITLSPGDQFTIGMGPESSNTGGWNKTSGADIGIILGIAGTVTLGSCTFAIDSTFSDADLHSGVFRTNPFGETLDNYVMQGGDPFGRDTGDGFETTQADGVANLTGTCGVPEPASVFLLGGGLVGLGFLARRSRAA